MSTVECTASESIAELPVMPATTGSGVAAAQDYYRGTASAMQKAA